MMLQTNTKLLVSDAKKSLQNKLVMQIYSFKYDVAN
jgi:hypothetical protein